VLPRPFESLIRLRAQTRLTVWIARVRLAALATNSKVDMDVDRRARVGKHVRVQFQRGTTNRLSVGPRTALHDDLLIQLRNGTVVFGPDCDIRSSCRFNVAGKLELEGHNVVSWGTTIHCRESVLIRERAICAEYVTIVDSRHFHSRDGEWVYTNSESSPVEVGRNVWLAAKCTVIMGSRIGHDCLVAANSVVGGTVEPETVVAGIPAKPIRSSLR
jgi:acetyltransferase-like isoleucine patch superfamily enzyme